MKFFTLFSLSLLASFTHAQSPALVDAIYGGSGCLALSGTVSARLSDDGNTVLVNYNTMSAVASPSTDIIENRKSCQTIATIHYASGWQFALKSFIHRGKISLPDNAPSAQVRSLYYFPNGDYGTVLQTQSVFSGRLVTAFSSNKDATYELWSPCTGSALLLINDQLTINTNGGAGEYSVALQGGGGLSHEIGIKWRRCSHTSKSLSTTFVPGPTQPTSLPPWTTTIPRTLTFAR